MKFKPGQKVLVLGSHKRSMTPEMRKFVGKVVTISDKKSGNLDWPYYIVEDDRWVWQERFFIDELGVKDPNILFQMSKRRKL